MRTALLIIDPQNDFAHPDGALYVPGAEEDMSRLAQYIEREGENLSDIWVTLDTHPVHDISHPSFWKNKQGEFAAPFTAISAEEIKNGDWVAQFAPEKALKYVEALEAQGEFPHFIWPHHCIDGSWGGAIQATLQAALNAWTKKTGKNYHTARKGTYAFSEHFGIFQAQIPDPTHPETQLNRDLMDKLGAYDRLVVGGEARSHCVATSVKQILDNDETLTKKMVLLEDCMSDVPNLGHLGDPIYERARSLGVAFERAAR